MSLMDGKIRFIQDGTTTSSIPLYCFCYFPFILQPKQPNAKARCCRMKKNVPLGYSIKNNTLDGLVPYSSRF